MDSVVSLPTPEGTALLYIVLGLALTSFLTSVYTVLRTLLPLLLPHPLARRAQKTGATSGEVTRPARLKSALRFAVFLAICDILAAVILVWEAAAAATTTTGLGGETASRLAACVLARPTLLLGVASISFFNVSSGRTIALGKADWIVWAPALGLVALGAGLASLGSKSSSATWLGLIIWLTLITTVVSFCFGRLLIAILRVRKATRQAETGVSPWGAEQDRVVGRHGSKMSKVVATWLPPFHGNFSNLSTSFIGTVGRSTSTLDLSTAGHSILPFSSSSAPSVGFAPSSRHSMESDQATLRDVRSPTPGSTIGLLAGLRRSTSGTSAIDGRGTPRFDQDHEVLTFEEIHARPSMGSYRSASTFGAGLVSGTTRQAIVQEAWGSSPAPGTGHSSPKVELSRKEARGAIVRIGGHLFAALLAYALILPYLVLRAAHPSTVPPLSTAILLALGVAQPGIVLAAQSFLSEGFWYQREVPPVLTSSSAANFEVIAEGEMQERPGTSSSYYAFGRSQSTLPGISPTGEDCVETRKGRVGRALSMVQTHPKLLLLPTGTDSSTSGAKTSQTHTRLRSLNLGKTFSTFGGVEKKSRHRSDSIASRKTFAGFEMRTISPMPAHRNDDAMAVTRALLGSRRPLSFAGTGKVPFGFGPASRSTPELVRVVLAASPSPSPTGNFTNNSCIEPTYHSQSTNPRSPPPDYTIDFLSAQVLPRLVPSVVLGRSTVVDSENGPLNRRRSSVGTATELAAAHGSVSSQQTRNIRQLSLPNLLNSPSPGSGDESTKVHEPSPRAKTPESVISSIAAAVRGRVHVVGDKSMRRRSWKDRTAKAWDEVEKQDKSQAVASSKRRRPEPIDVDAESTGDQSTYLRPPPSARSLGWSLDMPETADETEVLEEEGNIADESEGDDDGEAEQAEFEAHRRRRSVSPMSLPTSPVHDGWQNIDESIVFEGSQHQMNDEEIGTVHCASIRPVYRSEASDVDFTSHYSLRPTHIATGSLSSARSLGASSITSIGFRNTMVSGSWHARNESTGRFSGSDDNQSANEGSGPASRRSSTSSRPLALLAQRANLDHSSSASDNSDAEREMKKVERHASARSRTAPNALGVPLPPIPTIEEADNEDKSSGAPTPKTLRQRTASTPRAPSTSTPPRAEQPTRTPPRVTSRSRARQHQQRRSRDAASSADENVQPVVLPATLPLRVGPRPLGGGTTSMRGLR